MKQNLLFMLFVAGLSISPLYGQVKTHNIIAEDSLTILKDTIDKEFDFNTNSVNATGADGVDFTKVNFYPPEAASLMRYVNYPVSQLTGIPDIRIPLYTLKSGDVEIPMELSFHTDNYLRVNQLPGVAGAGWSLTSDLQITRSVNGFDDFKNTEGKIGYYYNTGKVEANYPAQGSSSSYSKSDLRRIAEGYIDMEPDKFYYRLPTKSGAFYFQRQTDGKFQPVSVPYNGVKISFNPTGQVFTLVDTDGTSYVFSATNRDYTQFQGGGVTPVTMSWKCDKIVNKLAQTEVTFTYGNPFTYSSVVQDNGRIEIIDNYNETLSVYDDCHTICNDQNQNPVQESYCPWWKAAGPKKKIYGTSSTIQFFTNGNTGPGFVTLTASGYNIGGGVPARNLSTLYTNNLTEISFRGGKITFAYTANNALSSIQVKKSSGDVVKTITLVQSTTSDKYQRTLNALTVGDEKYTFSYGINRLGGVMADIWGYKGQALSGSYVPLPVQDIDINVGTTTRFFPGCQVPDKQSYKVTIGGEDIFSIAADRTLLTINYPTGGRAEFIVGQNRFRDNQTIKGSGGFRIEKIRYYDSGGTSPVKERIYKYGPDEDGTGIPHTIPVLDGYGANTYTEQTAKVIYDTRVIHSFRKRTFGGETVEALTFDNGCAVNYSQVAEYEAENGALCGKTVYTSDTHTYSMETASPTSPYPLREDEWYLGMPESVTYYKYKNGQYVWTKKTENQYNKYFDPVQIFRARCWTATEVLIVGGSQGSMSREELVENNAVYYLNKRGIRTGIVQLTGVDESEQDDNGNIIKKVTRYYYDSQKDVKPSRVERSQSDGTQEVEHLIYPTAYASSSGEGSFLSSLVSKNIVDYPIEHVFRRNGQVKAGTVNLFNSNGTLASVYTLAGATSADAGFKLSNRPQGNYVSDATTNTAFSKSSLYSSKTTVSRYDSYGNPLCITDTESGQTVCYIWSYTGLYPIVEIRNATYDAVKSALGTTPESYSSQSSPNMTAVNALRTNSQLKNAQVTTYTYELLKGMTSSTDPTGLTTYYSYDSQGRLSKIYIKEGGTDKTIKEYLYNYKVK
ncbi:hypothetical protein [Parabacteroides sp. AM08-6]|uniref:hypothetical protein n=1 Tax=Parabacteroides sp. AM08-6 TaxID=2292053 RepID=UPI000F00E1B5|nr:hypothetical protein [Parabacteroides sp. AM08-6]RHJ83938.1 hypothetical protein DW103_06510 [Parabacteroides sp. AM08-6]